MARERLGSLCRFSPIVFLHSASLRRWVSTRDDSITSLIGDVAYHFRSVALHSRTAVQQGRTKLPSLSHCRRHLPYGLYIPVLSPPQGHMQCRSFAHVSSVRFSLACVRMMHMLRVSFVCPFRHAFARSLGAALLHVSRRSWYKRTAFCPRVL